jgi:hypothetical protein
MPKALTSCYSYDKFINYHYTCMKLYSCSYFGGCYMEGCINMRIGKKAVILLILLAAPIVPIFANGDMSGCPGGDCSGQNGAGPISSDSGSTIIMETSGGYSSGYSGGYSVGYSGGYSSGYSQRQQGGITIGYQSPPTNQYKTPFLGVLISDLQVDSSRLGDVGAKLETLKQTEEVGEEKWKKLDELQNEVNDIQRNLQQNIDAMKDQNTITWDAGTYYAPP